MSAHLYNLYNHWTIHSDKIPQDEIQKLILLFPDRRKSYSEKMTELRDKHEASDENEYNSEDYDYVNEDDFREFFIWIFDLILAFTTLTYYEHRKFAL